MNATSQNVTPARQVFVEPTAEILEATRVADTSLALASDLLIDSCAGYQAAANELVDLRSRWNEIEKQRVYLKEPYLEGGRRIDAFFRVPLDRLAQAAGVIKLLMIDYKTAEDKKEEDARRAEEARRRAEREAAELVQREAAERQRLAQLEADRRVAQAQALADEEAKAARAAAAAGDAAARAKAEADAVAAQERADAAAKVARAESDAVALAAQLEASAAQDAMDMAELAPAPIVVHSQAVAHGVSSRKAWAVLSIDKAQLVTAAAAALAKGDDSLLAYLIVDEKVLGGIARALKSAARVPGVEFGQSTVIASTGRR